MKVETTKRISVSSEELKEILVAHLKAQGIEVSKRDIQFQVYGGDPGGYGSMGDPAHVYNPPTDPSFSGATIVVRSFE